MTHRTTSYLLFIFTVIAGMLIFPNMLHAAIPAGTCTTDPTFNVPTNINIIQTIVDNIQCILYGGPDCRGDGSVAKRLFTSIADGRLESSYSIIIMASASLFVIIFAISFMLGIIQLSLIEFTIRAVKFSVVALFVTTFAWDFFYNTVGVFFQNGTNWLIGRSVQIALGTIPGLDPEKPFMMIDYAIATAFSAKMFVTVMAMLFTGQYGWLYFILMVLGLGSFIAALFQAVWIYLMSMVVRAFLFGLAPLFFPFLLFSRTRHLFDGWLNQLVNTMLQPVLLFTFFSFFVVLVQAAMENILKERVCYMPGAGLFDGLPSDVLLPRPTIDGHAYGGAWGWLGPVECPENVTCKVFFVDLIDVVIFILLTQLAWRFNSIAINIAKEIAGVSTTFNIPGAFTNMLSPRHASTRRAMGEFENFREGQHRTNMAQAEAAAGGGAAPPVNRRNAP